MKNSYKFWNILFWINIAATIYLFLYSFLKDTPEHSHLYLGLTIGSLIISYGIKHQINRIKKNQDDTKNS